MHHHHLSTALYHSTLPPHHHLTTTPLPPHQGPLPPHHSPLPPHHGPLSPHHGPLSSHHGLLRCPIKVDLSLQHQCHYNAQQQGSCFRCNNPHNTTSRLLSLSLLHICSSIPPHTCLHYPQFSTPADSFSVIFYLH